MARGRTLLGDEAIVRTQEKRSGPIDHDPASRVYKTYTARWVRAFYEEARRRDHHMIQSMLDIMVSSLKGDSRDHDMRAAVAKAIELGFKPTPTDKP